MGGSGYKSKAGQTATHDLKKEISEKENQSLPKAT